MASWANYGWLTRNIGSARTQEERFKEKENWVIERQTFGKQIKNQLPVIGQLIINWPGEEVQFVEHAIVPQNGISRMGYVNEIWVPGRVEQIHIDDVPLSPFYGVYQVFPISYISTQVKVYGYSDKYLLLSPKKLEVVPYAKRS
jgi:hypothetical protein